MARVDVGAKSHADDEVITFDYFGTELRANPALTDADLLDFMETNGDLEENDPKAAAITKSFIREAIHPDDFDTFWSLAKQHRQSTAERVEAVYKLIEAAVGTPTEQSSDSSGGLQSTASNSTGDSSLRAQHRLENKGRADLAVAVLQRREALQVA